MIFKIVEREAWHDARRDGIFRGSAHDLRDGFIHFSAAHQVRGTAAKHFKGVVDLLLVAIDDAALGSALVWEPARGGELFPHLYGPLAAVRRVAALPLGADARHVFPWGLGE